MHQINAVTEGPDVEGGGRVEVSAFLLLLFKGSLRFFHSFQAGARLDSPVRKDVFVCVAHPLHNPIVWVTHN
jgi:hypothetical protein